ncbi:uncharacterized protein si:ch211-256a21.4 isoform X1 [Astyanax mexicanus]|uniref:uncharacterized protein si:ch211-256a21.4 isoform X1 n=2 Tax=Astyanax mexicanus TaxID=7994 RepID=UPI0020CAB96D|nr:uncharacterized protein si:ch211-256a21.4 isoform X1 [Astyanax mexicanus]
MLDIPPFSFYRVFGLYCAVLGTVILIIRRDYLASLTIYANVSPFSHIFLLISLSSVLTCFYSEERVMKGPELKDSTGRFRFAQSCLGLAGCLCISYAVWTPHWLDERGLWVNGNESSPDDSWTQGQGIEGLGAQRVFSALSFIMAVSSGVLCLVFAFCWTSRTVRSYSNTRSLLMAGQALYPTMLLLITLVPTEFFFLLSWALFTNQHIAEIRVDITRLGFSYWTGMVGWALLLAVLPVVFLVEQFVVPDVLPELMRQAETWWKAPEVAYARSFSESFYNHRGPKLDKEFNRYLSVP